MRRIDREIDDPDTLVAIMSKCEVCRLAFFDSDYPYLVPLNFGFEQTEDGINLYFHSAAFGTKLDLLKRNNHVAFEMDCSHVLRLDEIACNSTMEFESVCGKGILALVEEAEKEHGLAILMRQYEEAKHYSFDPVMLHATQVLRLTVNSITGKRHIRG